jgi:hypothetical protein
MKLKLEHKNYETIYSPITVLVTKEENGDKNGFIICMIVEIGITVVICIYL